MLHGQNVYTYAGCVSEKREIMEPARKRRISPVFEHFNQITPNKVTSI